MPTPDPSFLRHKSVVLLPYEPYDGPYANDTDCKYLSVGWAQYDSHDLSVKALRHTGSRWSRQSEELPLHRAVDATMLVASLLHAIDKDVPVTIPANTLENQHEQLTIPVECSRSSDQALLKSILSKDSVVRRRLRSLSDLLDQMRKEGSI